MRKVATENEELSPTLSLGAACTLTSRYACAVQKEDGARRKKKLRKDTRGEVNERIDFVELILGPFTF